MTDERGRVLAQDGDPSRVLALTDGVFAIIVTLLVLEIHVPDLAGGETLGDARREVRPSFVAFLISFVVVAMSWVGHRHLFALIKEADAVVVWLNILNLLPMSLVPFGASLLARYQEEPVALEMYGALLLAIGVTRLAIWVYATGRPRLLIRPVDARTRSNGVALVAVPGVAYAVAIGIAETAPTASLVIYAAVPVAYFAVILVGHAIAPNHSDQSDDASV